MFLGRKSKNALRSLVQTYGTPAAKRRLWNAEFGNGRWNCLDSTAGDCVYPYVERYSHNGSILDLGCGSGSTANELDVASYSLYVGVDISDVALEKARVKTEQNGRTAQNVFYRSDISSYTPDRQFDLILFRDSLYYLARHTIGPALRRYARYLRDPGTFVVRLANGHEKYAAIVRLIERRFKLLERGQFADPDAVVLVFRP